jgi:hypothetical protein
MLESGYGANVDSPSIEMESVRRPVGATTESAAGSFSVEEYLMAANKGPVVMLDASCLQDMRILKLRAKHGMEGFGVYIGLICLMRSNGGRWDLDAMSMARGILGSESFDAVLETLRELTLITDEVGCICSPRLIRDIQEYERVRKCRVKGALKTHAQHRAQHTAEHGAEHLHPSLPPSILPSINPSKMAGRSGGGGEPEGWAVWWSAYPRKVGKAAAIKSYIRALKTVSPQVLKDGLDRAVKGWAAAGTEPQFIPHPATWLNGGRWEDQTPAQVPGRAVKTGPLLIDSTPGKDYGKSGRW